MKSGIRPVSCVSEAHLKLAEKSFFQHSSTFLNLLSYEVEGISNILQCRQTRKACKCWWNWTTYS